MYRVSNKKVFNFANHTNRTLEKTTLIAVTKLVLIKTKITTEIVFTLRTNVVKMSPRRQMSYHVIRPFCMIRFVARHAQIRHWQHHFVEVAKVKDEAVEIGQHLFARHTLVAWWFY